MKDQTTTIRESRQRVALVTGATGAIGKAIAQGIAAKCGYRVVLACRDETKAKQAAEDIIQTTGNRDVTYEIADLSRQSEVKALAGRWQGPLHVLVNNAAVAPPRRMETPEGIELQLATNVLSYLWLTLELRNALAASPPSRVVNVASYWAGDLSMDDLEFKRRPYDHHRAYRQSKQANRMLTVAVAKDLHTDGIDVNACHPGDVNSRLSNALGFGGFESPTEGAATPVWLATEDTIAGVSGKYFEHRKEARCRFAENSRNVNALYRCCLDYDTRP